MANEMVRLIETATAPILAVDSNGMINGWNAKIAQVTGLPVSEAMGRSLVKDLVTDESVAVVERLLYLALRGNFLHQPVFLGRSSHTWKLYVQVIP